MLFCLDLDASIQQAQGGDIQFAFNTILVFCLPWGLGLGHLNLTAQSPLPSLSELGTFIESETLRWTSLIEHMLLLR